MSYETPEEIDELYNSAVMDFRRRVELDGEHWEQALGAVTTSRFLGLGQIAQLHREAEQHYGPVRKDVAA